MRRKWTGALMALLIGMVVLAGCRHRTPEARADRAVEHIADELDLNASQRAQLDRTKAMMLDKRKEVLEVWNTVMNELIAQMKQERIDQTKLNAVIDESKAKLSAMSPDFVSHLAEFHASLNEEQRSQIIERLEKIKERRQRRFGS